MLFFFFSSLHVLLNLKLFNSNKAKIITLVLDENKFTIKLFPCLLDTVVEMDHVLTELAVME